MEIEPNISRARPSPKGLPAIVMITAMILIVLSGCTKEKSPSTPTPRPIPTTEVSVTPTYPIYQPKESTEPTPSEIEPIKPEVTSSPEPSDTPEETPDIKDTSTSSPEITPSPAPSPTITEPPQKVSDQDLIKSVEVKSIELGYRTPESYSAWAIGLLDRCTVENIEDTKVKISFIISKDIPKADQEEAINLIFKEVLGITSIVIEEIDVNLVVTLDSSYWNNSIELYKIQSDKRLNSAESKILNSENGLEIGYMVYTPYKDGTLLVNKLLRSVLEYKTYNWLRSLPAYSIYFTDSEGKSYELRYTIQSYEEYKYSWNGLANSTFDSPHFIEIDSLVVNMTTSDVKISIPKNISYASQINTYQFFISLYKDLLSDAYSISSSGDSEIACYMSQNDYYKLIDTIKTELKSIDPEYSSTLGQVLNIKKSKIDESGEDYICKALTSSYLYNRILGNVGTTATVNILDDKGECVKRYVVSPDKQNTVEIQDLTYADGLTSIQKIMQSELYRLEGNPDSVIPQTPTIDISEKSIEGLSIEDSKVLIEIIKNTVVYSNNNQITIAVILSETDETTIKQRVNQVYNLYNNIWEWDKAKWEVKGDNTIRIIVQPDQFATLTEQIFRVYNDYCYKVIEKIFKAGGFVGITEELPSTVIEISNPDDAELKKYIYQYAVCDFLMSSFKSVNTSELRQIDVQGQDDKVRYTISNFM